MKNICALLAFVLLASFNTTLSTAFAQGVLTPPGAPAPTMKSLDQIEARTPITNTASLKTISQPGSYYLTGNLTVSTGDGINITANDVTLDLNGFTIASTSASASGYGIKLASGLSDITLCNGHILGGVTNNGSGVYGGGGFNYGIYYIGSSPLNVQVSRISVAGCMDHGIYLNTGNSVVVEDCTVRTVGSEGIIASTVKSCTALDCGGDGIYGDQVSDCRGQSTGSGDGLYSTLIAQNCSGFSGSSIGLSASTALNCYGQSSSSIGLFANAAQNCYGQSNSDEGISATTAQNCFGYSVSGGGLNCNAAQNCYGLCDDGSGTGLNASQTASGCYGYSFSGTGLSAFIANVCHGATGSGTTITTTHNVNSF